MEQSDEDELKENLQIDYLASKTQECDSLDSLTSSSNNTSKCSDSSPYDIGTDESDRLADDSSQKSPKKRLLTLCWRLICDIMLVIFIISTVLGVVTNSNQPKIRGAKRPRPFLINAGPVKDYYQGDVFQTFSDAGLFENSLVMFYAPWDRESQEARSVLKEVGEFFAETDILVSGVNCWYPTSDCAKEFGGKASGNRFPVFVFYPSYLKGIQYRGPIRADHLISWILRCRYPVIPLLDVNRFNQISTEHSNVLVGYLPQLRTNKLDSNLPPLLQCANSLLETDPDTRVLVTSDANLARALHLHVNHPLRLHTWNTSYSYPNKTIDGAKCHVWTLRHVSRPVTWLQLPARKSLVLKNYLGTHSLLVFMPRNRIVSSNQIELTVMEVASRYRDCNSSSQVIDLISRLRERLSSWFGSSSLSSNGFSCSQNTRLSPQNCRIKQYSKSSDILPACVSATWSNASFTECHSSSQVHNHHDEDVNLLQLEYQMNQQSLIKLNSKLPWEALRYQEYDPTNDPLFGLSCKNNQSLNILLVDSSQKGYSLIADSMGINLDHDKTTVVVTSLAEDSVSNIGSVTSPSELAQVLESVLINWHNDGTSLGGSYGLRSSERSRRVYVGEDTSASCDNINEVSCIREITADQFVREVIHNEKKSTVLFYTSSFCSQCTVASFVMHSVARMLDQAGIDDIQFRMLDSTRNDPPVQFTALAYPSVIFFPRGESDQSRVFPSYKELNITSILTFIISNLSPARRLQLGLSSCDSTCLTKLSLSAGDKLTKLENTRRRSVLRSSLRQSLAKQIRHVRTILYVISALKNNLQNNSDLPESHSGRFYSTILDNFIYDTGSK